MPDFKIPEGEKFFAFMVWVALIGAAIILVIDYNTKKQLLNLALEVREGLNEQGHKRGFAGPANSASPNPVPNVADLGSGHDAGMEKENVVEHAPFPIRQTSRKRDDNGRFASENSDGIPGSGNPTIPGTNHPVES